MSETPGARLQNWLAGKSEADLDFEVILVRIWDLLRGQAPEAEQAEHFHHLCAFVQRARPAQSSLLRRLCEQRGQSWPQSILDRAVCLYARMKPQLKNLQLHLDTLPGDEFYPYLYRALENNLILCNSEAIRELSRQGQSDLPWTFSDGLTESGTRQSPPSGSAQPQTLGELLHNQQAIQRAGLLAESLRRDWDEKHLNALCHYYEVLCGIPSQRLAKENNANIHQIHSRLRSKLRDYLQDHGFGAEEARLFFRLHLEQFCQETPVSATYKLERGDQ